MAIVKLHKRNQRKSETTHPYGAARAAVFLPHALSAAITLLTIISIRRVVHAESGLHLILSNKETKVTFGKGTARGSL